MHDLDRILSSEESLTPSPGFEARVMEAVQRAAEPSRLPFPWGRFIAGLCACLMWAFAGVVVLNRIDFSVVSLELAPAAPELGYATAAVLASFAMLRGQRMLTHRR